MIICDSLPCFAVVTMPSGPIGLSSDLLATSIASRISQNVYFVGVHRMPYLII